MRKLFTLLLFSGFCFILNAQVNSVPGGPFNWSSAAAWVGGVPPTSGQVANIVNNSTINLDVPVVHAANINVMLGGMLTSPTPTNSLTINGANLTNDGTINFVAINAVPITINNGHYFGSATSFMQSGNFYVSFSGIGANSNNHSDFNVIGTMTVDGSETFDNFVYVGVSGATTINAGCTFNNNANLNSASISNTGNINNAGNISVSGSVLNLVPAYITSDGNYISIGADLNNMGNVSTSDSMSIAGDVSNSGSFTNDTAIVNIAGDLYNSGTLTGSGNGQYDIGVTSTNSLTGIINGDIDVCDATLVPTTYLDVDSGTVDFLTVTFCTVSYAGIESSSDVPQIEVYPNPSNGIFNIANFDNGSISILNVEGRVILNREIQSSNQQIDLTAWPDGIYFIQVLNDGHLYSSKLIKQ